MPSSLPVELLRLICDNFACPPISNDGALKNPHRHELLSLCLTSKIFRQIAQPLLFALIAIKTDDFEQTVKALLASDPDGLLLKESRMVILTPSKKERPKTVEKSVLIDFLLACRGLEEIVGNSLTWEIGLLSRLSTFCFTYCPHAALTSFPDLRKLCLTDVVLVDVRYPSYCLPLLSTLSLANVDLPEPGFRPRNFPSLRHFAYDNDAGILDRGATSMIDSFANQLDSLILKVDLVTARGGPPPAWLNFVLVDYIADFNDESFPQDAYGHLRIRRDTSTGTALIPTSFVYALTAAAEVIEDQARCRCLQSVYLSPLDHFETSTQPVSTRQAVDRLILACRNRKIQVVHEMQPMGLKAETQLSEEFRRRMTKERIERESLSGK